MMMVVIVMMMMITIMMTMIMMITRFDLSWFRLLVPRSHLHVTRAYTKEGNWMLSSNWSKAAKICQCEFGSKTYSHHSKDQSCCKYFVKFFSGHVSLRKNCYKT